MAWPTNALASKTEAEESLRTSSSVTRIDALASEVVGVIEAMTGCPLVTGSTEIDEYHDLEVRQNFLVLACRPVRSVAHLYIEGVEQDPDLYVVNKAAGMVMMRGTNPMRAPGSLSGGVSSPFVDFPEDYYTRLSGAAFPAMVESAEVKYLGGYDKTADVPGDLRRAFLETLARVYREEERKSQGLSGEIAVGMAVGTKFIQDYVSAEAKAIILRHANRSRTARG